MHKTKIICFIILIFAFTNIFAQSREYELNNVKNEYIGTYIPVDLELRLYQSRKFYESLLASRNYGTTQPHDVLYLQKNICYSDLAFHDGYAIPRKEFLNYKFITGEGGIFCIDNNGYLYRKISNAEYGYSEYIEYVMNIILSNCQNSPYVKTDGENLIIYDKKYEVILDGLFLDTTNAVIWLQEKQAYVLEINGINGELYTGKGDEFGYEWTKGALFSRFPELFKINPNEVPDYSKVPKEQLRLFRNLIFARNGYIFKSKDLQDFFNSCSWYEPTLKFNESAMRKDEKDFVSLMQMYEEKNIY